MRCFYKSLDTLKEIQDAGLLNCYNRVLSLEAAAIGVLQAYNTEDDLQETLMYLFMALIENDAIELADNQSMNPASDKKWPNEGEY